MDAGTFVMLICLLLGGAAWYSQQSLRNKIFCTFRRPNKTKIEKFVSLHSKYVVFDNAKFRVNPRRITLMWYNRGINALFPTWVPSLDFRWDTPQPLDPDTFEVTWDTPEARNAAKDEEDLINFSKGAAPPGGKKESIIQKYLPWVTLAVLVVVAFWVFQLQGQVAGIAQLQAVK